MLLPSEVEPDGRTVTQVNIIILSMMARNWTFMSFGLSTRYST